MRFLLLVVLFMTISCSSFGAYTPFPVSANGTKNADIQSVYFGGNAGCTAVCTTGNCIICNKIGGKITSVSWAVTGGYNINGIDGTKYNCTGQGLTTASAMSPINHMRNNSTSTYARVTSSNSSGVLLNGGYMSVTCIGKL